MEAPPSHPPELLDLPPELLTRLLFFLPESADIAACLRAGFARPIGTASAAEALELRAAEADEAVPLPPAGWSDTPRAWLVFREVARRSARWQGAAAAGTHHSAFVDAATGGVRTCGADELADGTRCALLGHDQLHPHDPAARTPLLVPALVGVRVSQLAVSATFTLALSDAGLVYAWGGGSEGQLGQGDEFDRPTPALIVALADDKVTSVACGDDHSLAVTQRGQLYSWGYGVDGRLGHPEAEGRLLPERVEALSQLRVSTVSAGRWHSLALGAAGELYSWGGGMFGRLGHGDEDSARLPKRVAALEEVAVVGMAAGTHHTLAISATGEAYSWGYAFRGCLGHGDTLSRSTPARIEALEGVRLVAVSAGYVHSLGVADDGGLYSWGSGEFGQLGHRDDTTARLVPERVKTLQSCRVVAAAAGNAHSIAVTDTGRAYGWGYAAGRDSRLGLGASRRHILMPRPYPSFKCHAKRDEAEGVGGSPSEGDEGL